jgi:protein-L-isoaspartate(D-aspartate) O-methyltransferase
MEDLQRQRAQLLRRLKKRGISHERVLAALDAIPRERFVPEPWRDRAYDDTALPVAAGQTISQPFVVALMTQMLNLQGDEEVLEIGTGTGYQTAILSRLAQRVVTVERLEELAAGARKILADLGLRNIEFHTGDGTLGCRQSGPYDAILVTAGAPEVPQPLYEQLKPGGRMILPVGDEESQLLTVVVKGREGPEITDAGGCRFVKLIGQAGWTGENDAAG